MHTRNSHIADPQHKAIRRVLVIDDDKTVLGSVAVVLESFGLRVEICDGMNVGAVITAFDPHLILLDVQLGVSDAFMIIRAHVPSNYPGVVAIITGNGLDVAMDVTLFGEMRGLRMAPPMLKPFDIDDLQAVLSVAEDLFARRAISMAARQNDGTLSETTGLRVRQTLQQGLAEIWYQPKFEAASGRLSGAEALIRARLPSGEVVLPHTLLKDIDQTDMFALTDFILTGAVEHTSQLGAAGWHGRLSVNVPVSYLLKCDAPRLLRGPAQRADWPGMIFEITEDEALEKNSELEFVASQLKLYAVSLSIDDFGAGYSSLARLRDLPFSELKLDKSFVQGCATDSVKQTICRNILALGAELGTVTVAEGVETEAELRLCIDWGCDQVQGFFLAKPMPFADLLQLVQEPPQEPAPLTVLNVPQLAAPAKRFHMSVP